MESDLLQKLADKSLTSEQLLQKVEEDYDLLPEVLSGVSSHKATVRYTCAKVLMELSRENPEKLYSYFGFFIKLLDSKYRILIWNAMSIIANLTKVDDGKKFDPIFNKFFSFINDEYMVTVANVVGNASKIALAKPGLTERITSELLKVEHISTSPHLTDECKRVIAEKAIESFDLFFDQIKSKEKVISFARKQANSSRVTLRKKAKDFLLKHNR